MGTKYNVLYNGEIALEEGRERIDDALTDNFWDLLSVERMDVKEEVTLEGQSENSDFERAEEKAIKAVQKHGMNIKGKEYNPQIDEAYLLLGRARYFDQRFISAIEAFNYILYKYPGSDKINRAKVWREKANIRLENNELAIQNLQKLIEQESLEDQDMADATASMAQAYINVKAKDSAIVQLEIAANYTKKNKEKGRYNFIKGQLYNEAGDKDSANIAFDRVIDLHRKIPRSYYINAHLEKIANFDMVNGDKLAFTQHLSKLENDRENRPFLDKIYYRIAEYHRANKADSVAIAYYNKSLRTPSVDKYLKALNYQTLGDMHFDGSAYAAAGAYYDSTMTQQKLNSKPYRMVKRKRENLEDVIHYEGVAKANDSILQLVAMSNADRLSFFEKYIERLKAEAAAQEQKAEADKRRTENAGQQQSASLNSQMSKAVARGTVGVAGSGSPQTFYFYNQNTVAYGKTEFLKLWGERSLKDNWRSSSSKVRTEGIAGTTSGESAVMDETLYDPEFYIAQIPVETRTLDSLAKDRNYAYYQLGIIYKEKFNENMLAKNKLETLLRNQPEERLILPSKYNLYHIYVALNLSSEADIMKADIIKNFPESRYADILRNPQSLLADDKNSPESVYEQVYQQYQDQDFQSVISAADTYITDFEGDPIVPKFEILKASAMGRLYGLEAYKDGVNFVALTYANTPEGKKAQDILQNVIPKLAFNMFVDDDMAKKFIVVYQFDAKAHEEMDGFVKDMNDVISKVNYYKMYTAVEVYNKDTTFVVIHGLKSVEGAAGFAEILKENKYKIDRHYIAISSENYEIVQRHKNLEAYLDSNK